VRADGARWRHRTRPQVVRRRGAPSKVFPLPSQRHAILNGRTRIANKPKAGSTTGAKRRRLITGCELARRAKNCETERAKAFASSLSVAARNSPGAPIEWVASAGRPAKDTAALGGYSRRPSWTGRQVGAPGARGRDAGSIVRPAGLGAECPERRPL
jgi:hypothetical protein